MEQRSGSELEAEAAVELSHKTETVATARSFQADVNDLVLIQRPPLCVRVVLVFVPCANANTVLVLLAVLDFGCWCDLQLTLPLFFRVFFGVYAAHADPRGSSRSTSSLKDPFESKATNCGWYLVGN